MTPKKKKNLNYSFVITVSDTTVSYSQRCFSMIPLMMRETAITMLAPIAAVISTDLATIMVVYLYLLTLLSRSLFTIHVYKMYEKQTLAGEEKTECSEQLSS